MTRGTCLRAKGQGGELWGVSGGELFVVRGVYIYIYSIEFAYALCIPTCFSSTMGDVGLPFLSNSLSEDQCLQQIQSGGYRRKHVFVEEAVYEHKQMGLASNKSTFGREPREPTVSFSMSFLVAFFLGQPILICLALLELPSDGFYSFRWNLRVQV